MSVARRPCLALTPHTTCRSSVSIYRRSFFHYSSNHHLRSSRSWSTRPPPSPSSAAPPHPFRHAAETPRIPARRASEGFPNARRRFSTSPIVRHGHLTPPKPGEELNVTFTDKDGSEHTFQVAPGDNLLDIAQAEELEMEGACGGSCACSTCHVIVEDEAAYDLIPEPSDDENDMLDLAFGLTETSRLGCQVRMAKELDGLRVRLPSMTRNLQASDFGGAKKE